MALFIILLLLAQTHDPWAPVSLEERARKVPSRKLPRAEQTAAEPPLWAQPQPVPHLVLFDIGDGAGGAHAGVLRAAFRGAQASIQRCQQAFGVSRERHRHSEQGIELGASGGGGHRNVRKGLI